MIWLVPPAIIAGYLLWRKGQKADASQEVNAAVLDTIVAQDTGFKAEPPKADIPFAAPEPQAFAAPSPPLMAPAPAPAKAQMAIPVASQAKPKLNIGARLASKAAQQKIK